MKNLTKERRKEFVVAAIEMRAQLKFALHASKAARLVLRNELRYYAPDFFELTRAFTSEAAREIVLEENH